MAKIYNFQDCPLSDRNGTYGGNSGDKEGILIRDEPWIVKYPKSGKTLHNADLSYTASPVSEYLGSHIYELLGYPVHETLLGVRNHHVVVACRDFCDDHHRLVEFRQLKNTYNAILNEKLSLSMTSTGSDHFVNLNEVRIHLQYNPSVQNIPGLSERFWDCVVIDGLINNNDRNNGNWGILRGPEGDMPAPIFDNGASFSPNVPDDKLLQRLKNPQALQQSACSGRTAYSLDGERSASFQELLKADVPEVRDALIRTYPNIRYHLSGMYDLIQNIPEQIGPVHIISAERKEEYIQELSTRFSRMLEPALARVEEEEKKQRRSRDEMER